MLGARSVAIVGASARPDSFGARMVIEAQRSSARMHLVNPRYDRIGDAAVRAVAGRPRRARRPGAARRARRRAGRPGEGGGREPGRGRPWCSAPRYGLRDEVAAVASEAGMAVCGAGCMGFVNNAIGLRALGLPRTRPAARGRGQPGHAFRVGLLDAAARAPRVRLPARRLLGSGNRHRHRRLRRLRARRSRAPGVLALMLETPRAVPRLRASLRAGRRRGRSRGHPARRRIADGPRDGGRPLRRAGRRGRGVAGVLRRGRRGPGARPRRVHRHGRTVQLRQTASRRRGARASRRCMTRVPSGR